MKLSIIVPFFNAENHLERCVNSLVNQDLDSNHFEIILINDGSTDQSKGVSEKLVKLYPNIVLHTHKNIGLGASRNVGIQMARGEYIYFIDADDYLVFGLLGTVLKYIQEYELDLVGFKYLSTTALDLFDPEAILSIEEVNVQSGIDFVANSKSFVVMAWWYVMKKEHVIQNNLKFPEGRYLEDGPFTFRLFLQIKRMAFLPIDGYRYVKTPNSIMNKESRRHIIKLIDDYKYLIDNFNTLKKDLLIRKDIDYSGFIKKIQFWSDVNVYMLFYRFIKVNLPVSKINKILNHFEKIKAYPLKFFVGEENNSFKHKLITSLFNNKYLFYISLYPLRLLYKLRIIKLP
ncbi:glycosyltransferase family 2 protein [Hyunsoonleella pacifica]|uniref:Glycosyltransferase n=1 Tax=Hyunsoonleella pacifica TaxID=1080224 RepID=A0A4V2JB70_9FLAO|nr:glycosyltransferase [Hyunsoonleella pacifica]TBN17618.1 glycosyltransferase [Hyunsoonleella pacifica]GGD10388.1 glycosyl transferase [Hyunsoonleella pacifica]